MDEAKKIIALLLLAIFTVFVGFVVTECAMSDLTGRPPEAIIEFAAFFTQ